MIVFDKEKFCRDMKNLRGEKSQEVFSGEMNINRSTLSLLESGKQTPSLEILSKMCSLGGFQADEYFHDQEKDALFYLMGSLEEGDKKRILELMERIKIKEKYEVIFRRSRDDFNK